MEFLRKLDKLTALKPVPGHFSSMEGSARFSNHDLDPVTPDRRKWQWYQIGGFWISEGFNLAVMQTVSSAVALGLNPGLAVVACLIGNILVMIPCAASGYLGARYGLNFPVLIRSSFGLWGAYMAVLFRGVFCFILYGVQGVLGGSAVQCMLEALSPSFATWHIDAIPEKLGITAPGLVSFFVFWIASFPLLFLSVPTLRYLFMVKIAIVPFFYVALFTWALTAANGFGPLFSIPSKIENGRTVAYAFFYCMTATIGGNDTFALNMADVTRYATNGRQAWLSQVWAAPIFLTLTELLGAILGATSQVVYGQVLFNPVSVILLWNNRPAKFFAGLVLAFCNIGTNITGNSIPFGNDLTAWFPKRINVRRGQIVCAFLGIIIQPWYLNSNAKTFLAFINGYSMFLGPICGVMMADYFVVHRMRGIDVRGCYQPHGPYWYWHGFNLRAFVAVAVAMGPNFPGLIQSMGVDVKNNGIVDYFSATWITAIVISFGVYIVLNLIWKPPVVDVSSYRFEKGLIDLTSVYDQGFEGQPVSTGVSATGSVDASYEKGPIVETASE